MRAVSKTQIVEVSSRGCYKDLNSFHLVDPSSSVCTFQGVMLVSTKQADSKRGTAQWTGAKRLLCSHQWVRPRSAANPDTRLWGSKAPGFREGLVWWSAGRSPPPSPFWSSKSFLIVTLCVCLKELAAFSVLCPPRRDGRALGVWHRLYGQLRQATTVCLRGLSSLIRFSSNRGLLCWGSLKGEILL